MVYIPLYKKSKRTAKLSENSCNERRSESFQWRHLWRQSLYCYRFFLSFYVNHVPEMINYVHD